jgi:polyferredoxin
MNGLATPWQEVKVPAKKKLLRRAAVDHSQALRRSAQAAFLVLNVWIGAQFYAFVRHFEGVGPRVARPAGVEGWLPIAALMNLKYLIVTGHFPRIHPAAPMLLIAFLAISLAFRKAFCSWLCPIGTLSEALWKLGQRVFGRNRSLPRWADLSLRSLKYILLGLFGYAVSSMSAAAIGDFMEGPYGVVADVKMLNFFRYMSTTAAVFLMATFGLSLIVRNFWCRYLCPYGALMGLASLLSPARIRRDTDACIDCAKCARVCPSLLAVDKLVTIRSAECTGCMECVAVCPAEGALVMSLPRRKRLSPLVMAVGIAFLFLGIVGYAKLSGHWNGSVPAEVYRELVPRTQEFAHP